MEFTQTVDYPTDIDTVIEMSLDPQYLETRFGRACAEPLTIAVDGPSVTAVGRVDPKIIPTAARAIVSADVAFTFTETWRRTEDGAVADTMLTCEGAPVSLTIESTVTPSGNGCARRARGSLTISVPFFGARLEKEAVSRAGLVVKAETGLASTWLTNRRR